MNKIWTSIYIRIITIILEMANIVGTLTKDGVQIPLDHLTARLGTSFKKVLKSLSVTETVHRGRPTGMAPVIRRAYKLYPAVQTITIPRMKAAVFLKTKAIDSINASLFAQQARTLPVDIIESVRELYSYQEAAVSHLCDNVFSDEEISAGRGVAYLELGTGLGKSAIGAAIIAQRQQPGIVVVPTKAISEQWVDEFTAAFPLMKVAVFNNASKKVCNSTSHDVIIIVINTFRDKTPEFLEGFGTIIIDEAHELQSKENSKALWLAQMVPAVLGLSATPADRKDGLDKFVTLMLAPVLKPTEIPNFDAAAVQFKNTVRIVEYSGNDAYTETAMLSTGTMSAILTVGTVLMDPERLTLVAREVMRLHCLHETLPPSELEAVGLGPRPAAAVTKDYPEGEIRRHGVFVFAETRDFLPILREALLKTGMDQANIIVPELETPNLDTQDARSAGTVSVLRGGVARTAVGDAKKHKAHIVLTTYGFSRRGISLPDMTAIVLATPRRNGLTQILGRITRRGGDESILRMIVDIVDVRTGLKGQATDRKAVYKQKGFPIEKVKVVAEKNIQTTIEIAGKIADTNTTELLGMFK